ncbi:hypothetical protein RQP46_003423 [Phenoliferia psychrophenolica]
MVGEKATPQSTRWTHQIKDLGPVGESTIGPCETSIIEEIFDRIHLAIHLAIPFVFKFANVVADVHQRGRPRHQLEFALQHTHSFDLTIFITHFITLDIVYRIPYHFHYDHQVVQLLVAPSLLVAPLVLDTLIHFPSFQLLYAPSFLSEHICTNTKVLLLLNFASALDDNAISVAEPDLIHAPIPPILGSLNISSNLPDSIILSSNLPDNENLSIDYPYLPVPHHHDSPVKFKLECAHLILVRDSLSLSEPDNFHSFIQHIIGSIKLADYQPDDYDLSIRDYFGSRRDRSNVEPEFTILALIRDYHSYPIVNPSTSNRLLFAFVYLLLAEPINPLSNPVTLVGHTTHLKHLDYQHDAYSIRNVLAGSEGGGGNGTAGGVSTLLLSVFGNTVQQRSIVSYKVGFSGLNGTAFNFVHGGKLPGVYGGTGGCSGGVHSPTCFSARLMWRNGGMGEVYAYLPTYNSSSGAIVKRSGSIAKRDYGLSLDTGSWTFSNTGWNEVTQVVVLNSNASASGGPANGYLAMYFNGNLAFERSDMIYRVDPSIGISRFFFSTFFGGSNSTFWASKGGTSYFKDFQFFSSTEASSSAGPSVTATFPANQ